MKIATSTGNSYKVVGRTPKDNYIVENDYGTEIVIQKSNVILESEVYEEATETVRSKFKHIWNTLTGEKIEHAPTTKKIREVAANRPYLTRNLLKSLANMIDDDEPDTMPF